MGGCALRADRDRQLGDRHPPGAQGEGDPRSPGPPRRSAREGDPRRARGRGHVERGGARRPDPGRAGRSAGRRRPARRHPRARGRRVAAHRRVRRDPQARGRPDALRVLRAHRLGPLRGRRGPRGQLRGEDRRRGPRVPPRGLPAAARGQHGAQGDDDRHGADRADRAARVHDPRQGVPRRGPGGDGGARDPDPRGARAPDERHARRRRRAPRAPEHPRPADGGDRGAGRGRHDLRRQDRDAHGRHAQAGRRGGRRSRRPGRRRAGAGDLRRVGRRAQPDPGDDRRALPRPPRATDGRGAVLVAVEVERADAERLQLRDRRPGRAHARRAPSPSPKGSSGRSPNTPAPGAG